MYRKILTAVDGSQAAWRALESALDLASRHRAELHVIPVLGPVPSNASIHGTADSEAARALAKEAVHRAAVMGKEIQLDPAGAENVQALLLHAAEHRFDLLAVGGPNDEVTLGTIPVALLMVP